MPGFPVSVSDKRKIKSGEAAKRHESESKTRQGVSPQPPGGFLRNFPSTFEPGTN